jgi:glyoxylase I family protein
MFKRIDHVEIVTDQPEKTVAFYTDVLGFKVRERDRIPSSGLGVPLDLVYLELGGTTVELITFNGAKVDPAPQNEHLGYRLIALEIEDMDRAVDYLKQRGSTSPGARVSRRPMRAPRSATPMATRSSCASGSAERY